MSPKNPISPAFNQFFIDLAPNNHKDWFDENRSIYENMVKKPFESLVQLLIDEVQKIDPRINPKPKECIFRINRDIRFAKDKTPYKMNRSAVINTGGKKDRSPNGFYLEMGPEHIRIYGGLYSLETEEMAKVRAYMANNWKAFQQVYSNKAFIKYFGSIRGEQAKRLPKEWKEIAEKEPLLYNKQWYFFSEMEASLATSATLIHELISRYKTGMEANQFFEKALK